VNFDVLEELMRNSLK
jgi:actin-like protein 6A